MIVDHVNTVLLGGASIAARRLHHSLLKAGVESRFWHADKPSRSAGDSSYHRIRWAAPGAGPLRTALDEWIALGRMYRFKRRLKRSLKGRPPGLEWFSPAWNGRRTPYDPRSRGSDLVHLHWVARLIDYPSFFAAIPPDFPIVWTLHDMNAFTGGCHCAHGCEAFAVECKHCPQLGTPGENDWACRSFRAKKQALLGKNLHVVAPSRRLEKEARRSQVLAAAHSFRTIVHGLDTDLFSPRERRAARALLGLPQDRVVIGFGADLLSNQQKGLLRLFAALSMLPDHSALLGLMFGKGEVPTYDQPLPQLRSLGYLGDPSRQAIVYSAMDVFVIPSLGEAFGLTGLEAMACGAPVVGFDSGGVVEYLRHGETGLLAQAADPIDLARHLRWLVDRPQERQRMGENARRMTLREFGSELQATRYLELYESLRTEREAGCSAP